MNRNNKLTFKLLNFPILNNSSNIKDKTFNLSQQENKIERESFPRDARASFRRNCPRSRIRSKLLDPSLTLGNYPIPSRSTTTFSDSSRAPHGRVERVCRRIWMYSGARERAREFLLRIQRLGSGGGQNHIRDSVCRRYASRH